MTDTRLHSRSWQSGRLTGVSDCHRCSTIEIERDDPIDRQLEHFVALIRDETVSRVTAADGLANLRITEAIALAARTGQTVTVNGVGER